MSEKTIATKPVAVVPTALVGLIRFVASCAVFIGLVLFIVRLPEVLPQLFRGEESLAARFATAMGSLSGSLRFAAVGAMAHVVTQITFGRGKKRARFDFLDQFGKYIDFEPASKAFNRRLMGVVCLVGGPLLSLVGNATMRGAAKINEPGVPILVFLVGLMIVLSSMFVFLSGLRNIAPRAESTLRWSKRSPILYLRSFQSDAKLFDRSSIGSLFKMLFFGPLAHQTIEHSLALAVKDFRPLVAIGHPGERLPPLGAARLYVSSDWQQVVAKLVAASPLVILRTGNTEGFWWEMEHLVKSCDPRKILIYLPQRDRKTAYQYWRDRAATHFPHSLPIRPGRAMFLAFGPDWQPYLLGVNGPSIGAWWRRPFGGRAPEIREALNIHLRNLGANPTRLPFLRREWFLMFLFVLFTLGTLMTLLSAMTRVDFQLIE